MGARHRPEQKIGLSAPWVADLPGIRAGQAGMRRRGLGNVGDGDDATVVGLKGQRAPPQVPLTPSRPP